MKKSVGDDDIAGKKMAIWIFFVPELVFTYKKAAHLITFRCLLPAYAVITKTTYIMRC